MRSEVDNAWLWSDRHKQPVRVEQRLGLWGDEAIRIWLPQEDAIVRVKPSDVRNLESADVGNADRIRFALCAARIANLAYEDVLLAPYDAAVIPLPHQIRALRKAVSQDRVRFLLADEVGLGKTIEAGLIARELKLRGLARRILVISPKGLVKQWQAEMKTHFGEDFRHLVPSEFDAFRKIVPTDNVWRACDQVICSLDSVKPLESRRGWTAEEIAEHNKDRFDDLVGAGWDLIIVDEAHRMGGSTDLVARHQLGLGLAEAAPYLLLLSATPHQGKSDAFHRLLTLLDKQAFPAPESVTRERVRPFVIRTEKRQAVDVDGKPLFLPRLTQLVPVAWAGHEDQKQLYDAVTTYVRHGYDQAIRQKKQHLGFLMLLMQRLVTSSTRSIATTLRKRLNVLNETDVGSIPQPSLSLEDLEEMDGQEQMENALRLMRDGIQNESDEVSALLRLAEQVEARGPDAKPEALLKLIYERQREEGDPDLKVLIFTEFVPTQQMLAEFFAARGISAVCLNGSMDMEERQRVQTAFSKDARLLLSTDAGGEGLNLQFCHVVVNFDIPWNPMRIEQRIGRVDRIGQKHPVRASNFVFEDSVEYRVREVLEEKLAVILEEFGVDKTGDVLDSAEAGHLFDSLYVEALLHPEQIQQAVNRVAETVRGEAYQAREKNQILTDDGKISADATLGSPLPVSDWVERMVCHYVQGYGGSLDASLSYLNIRWPGTAGTEQYYLPGREPLPGGKLLSLEEPRVRGLLSRFPRFAKGMPVPRIRITDIPDGIAGSWSLWEIRLRSGETGRGRLSPMFVHEDGRCLPPTARFLFDRLMVEHWESKETIDEEDSNMVFDASMEAATEQLRDVYLDLKTRHLNGIKLEEEKGEYSFRMRKKLIEGIGLPEVRNHRMRLLEAEKSEWHRKIESHREILPELNPVILLRVN
jgi:superfamily II DNA or RNA helicase